MRLADWRSRFQPRPDDEGAAVSGTELGEAMASAACHAARPCCRVSAARRPYHPRASARPRRWAPASSRKFGTPSDVFGLVGCVRLDVSHGCPGEAEASGESWDVNPADTLVWSGRGPSVTRSPAETLAWSGRVGVEQLRSELVQLEGRVTEFESGVLGQLRWGGRCEDLSIRLVCALGQSFFACVLVWSANTIPRSRVVACLAVLPGP